MLFRAAILCLFLGAVAAHANTFTPEGNDEALRLFENYKTTRGCDLSLPGRRVLLTGFGLFQDILYNPTGAIVSNIGNADVWPAQVEVNQRVRLNDGATLQDGKFITENGATALTRSLRIGDRDINLCVLVLDVLWDVSGAIVAYEMNRFQPEQVLMLGAGRGAMLEGGAINTAARLQGYYATGEENLANTPLTGLNLPLSAPDHELRMTWNNQAIRESLQPYSELTNIVVSAAPGARLDNNYICNHISYTALAAAQNSTLTLAGGLITIYSEMYALQPPTIGFFHLPSNLALDRATIENWGALVTSVIYHMGN